jgi:hypothetical protein
LAKTKSLKFKDGGSWLYAMTGPDGQAIWNIVEFTAVNPQQGFLRWVIWKNFWQNNGPGSI